MINRSIARAPFSLALATGGWVAVGLGTAGVFIPGLPTTVFILIAFYCFSRSSPRFARWLTEHPRLGSTLRPFIANGGLSRRAKHTALTAMWTSILMSSVLLLHVHIGAALGTVALGAVGTLAIHFGVGTVPAHRAAAAAGQAEGAWP